MKLKLLTGLSFVIISLPQCGFGEPLSRQELLVQKSKLQYNTAKVRVKLLREKEELRELNDRIMDLQKELMRKLDSQPEMQFILSKIEEVDKQLKSLE